MIDGQFLARRSPGVFAVAADGEAVLYDERHCVVHLLNSSGALLWECFDGNATVATIAAEIADGLDAPYERVLRDCLALVVDLRGAGLVLAANPDELLFEATVDRSHVELAQQFELDGVALLGRSGALLVNERGPIDAIDRARLTELGWRRVDVERPTIHREQLQLLAPHGEHKSVTAHPVRAIVLFGARGDRLKLSSPARRLASLASLLPADGTARARDLETLARMQECCEVVRELGYGIDETVELLTRLAEPPPH